MAAFFASMPSSSGSYSKVSSSKSSVVMGQSRSSRRYLTREGKVRIPRSRSRSRSDISLASVQFHPALELRLHAHGCVYAFEIGVLDVLFHLRAHLDKGLLLDDALARCLGFGADAGDDLARLFQHLLGVQVIKIPAGGPCFRGELTLLLVQGWKPVAEEDPSGSLGRLLPAAENRVGHAVQEVGNLGGFLKEGLILQVHLLHGRLVALVGVDELLQGIVVVLRAEELLALNAEGLGDEQGLVGDSGIDKEGILLGESLIQPVQEMTIGLPDGVLGHPRISALRKDGGGATLLDLAVSGIGAAPLDHQVAENGVPRESLLGFLQAVGEIIAVIPQLPTEFPLQLIEVSGQVIHTQGAGEVGFLSPGEELGHVTEVTQAVVDGSGCQHEKGLCSL